MKPIQFIRLRMGSCLMIRPLRLAITFNTPFKVEDDEHIQNGSSRRRGWNFISEFSVDRYSIRAAILGFGIGLTYLSAKAQNPVVVSLRRK